MLIHKTMSDYIGKELSVIVDRYMHLYVRELVEKYNLPADELVTIWNEVIGVKTMALGMRTCSYVFKKGKPRGTKCANRVMDPNSEFCSGHKNMRSKRKQHAKPITSAIVIEEEDVKQLNWDDEFESQNFDDLVSEITSPDEIYLNT